MIAYHIRLALLSLRRNPVLSALLVGAIALGVGISTAFVTTYYISAGNPIPHKSERLFYVEIDNWDPEKPFHDERPDWPADQLAYVDMRNLMESEIPTAQSGMYKSSFTIHPAAESGRPFRKNARLCFADFFTLFEVPFRYGGGWDHRADSRPDAVVVIDSSMNQRLFGGANSVGETIRIEDGDFTVVGVLAPWRPAPKYFDPHNGAYQEPESIFMPFDYGILFEAESSGNTWGWQSDDEDSFEAILQSENIWIQMWVQLDDRRQVEEYAAFLDAYVTEQQKLGRLQRPLNNQLLTVMEWLDRRDVVPQQTRGLLVISLLFLTLCSLNLIGIFLGKFLARAPEVGVRRALGASRASVFAQHLVECELVGLIGGILGIGLSAAVLSALNRLLHHGDLFHLDAPMIGAGLGMCLAAGLVAGLYPAWRICRVAPATHLKMQ